jgi:alpha-mannosidase
MAIAVDPHAGTLPAEQSFVSADANNIVITAVKQAEDDDSLIIRFYEWAGKPAQVKLQLPQSAKAAYDVNLMEKSEQPLTLGASGKEVTVSTKPYEIKSVRIVFK